MKLSILIVNWNSRELLRRCLLSIQEKCADLQTQIVVVDGGSFDGCNEMLASEFQEVEFVQSQANIGFARSNNLGFQRVTGDAVLLLNPDTEIRGRAVQDLLTELQRLPKAGILSPRLLNSDLTLQCGVHWFPRPVRLALDSEILRRALSRFSWWAPPSEFAPAETVPVEVVAGTCMLLWSKTYRDVGGFSSDYFMYAEDLDLCHKVHRRGLRMYHVPGAEVLHHGGCSSLVQSSKFSAVMIRVALHKYLRLNHGAMPAMAYRVFAAIACAIRTLVSVPRLAVVRGERRRRLVTSMRAWLAVISWSVGLERWTRQYA